MRIFLLALALVLTGCATVDKNDSKNITPTFGKKLAAGECGLYVWIADSSKTFTLFATPTEVSYITGGKTITLTEKNPTTPPASNRVFMDPEGKTLNLTLFAPQEIDGGTRYKAGRLTSLSDDGWEKIVPVVGLYVCSPPS